MVIVGGDEWKRGLKFRDDLRLKSALAKEYAALKIAVAKQYPNDLDGYTAGKADFVWQVLAL